MAKKVFGANSPKNFEKNGLKISDLLGFATGKNSTDITEDDISKALSSKGISGKDSKRILSAFSRFKDSDADYVLSQDGKSYNVFQDGKAKTTSGRKTGNAKGFGPSDLIGLGNNVNLLAGFASQFKDDYKKSITKPPTATTEKSTSTTEVVPKENLSAPKVEATSPISSTANRRLTKTEQEKFKVKLQNISDEISKDIPKGPSADFEAKLKAFHDKYNSTETTSSKSTSNKEMSDEERKRRIDQFLWNDGEFNMEDVRIGYESVENVATPILSLLAVGKGLKYLKGPTGKLIKKGTEKLSKYLPKKTSAFKEVGYSPDLNIPTSPSGLKKGGKIPYGAEGMKLKDLLGGYTSPEAKITTKMEDISPSFLLEQGEMGDENTAFGFSTTQPNIGGSDSSADPVNVAGSIAKYALPFASAAITRNSLKKMPNVEYTPVELMNGVVVDLPKPNFTLPYRGPVGPDVQSEIAGLKYAETAKKKAENEFSTKNALSRIDQKNRIVDRSNQGKMFNKQGEQYAKLFNAQLESRKILQGIASTEDALLGTHQNLQSDIAQRAAYKGEQQASWASEVLRNPEAYGGTNSPEYQKALKIMRSGIGFRQGGKLKLKK